MKNDKHTRVLVIAATAAVSAWPFGYLIALLLSVGQDGPGSALAHSLGNFVTFIVWAISTAVIIGNPGKGRQRLEKGPRTIVVLSTLILPAIAIFAAMNHQNYDLRVWNETDAQVNDVTVHMAGKRYSFGVVSNGLFAVKGFQQDRPEGSAEVSWTSEDGRSHLAEVDLSDVIPRRYDNGVLTFVIQADDNVRSGFFIDQ